ncbi:dextrin dextranase [Malassezia cuniculi]|uniref:Mannosyltransferase n=1 Tax=Malassezia cuniculi TaxID=948313 RepID=A0AAF0EXL3_9BASI|nr:dextrin dextranase [Malassezia cuniculi]
MQLLRDNPRLAVAWVPSWALIFALLGAVRTTAALFAVISDCDEVYNYWEPLHLVTFGAAFETWEYAPQYAIRSWAYILLHAPASVLAARVSKKAAFIAVRICLALVSAGVDATLVRSVARHVNNRVARYMVVLLATCTGPTLASVALLPSSLAMYATTLGMAFAMARASSATRTFGATIAFAFGALAGWPFALVAAVPFVLEELFFAGADPAKGTAWYVRRWTRGVAAACAALTLAVPIFAIDSLAYGRAAFVPLNTILYNVLGRARGVSPDLYGTEPWHYYVVNLVLNFGPAAALALLSVPAVAFAARRDAARFSGRFGGAEASASPGSSPVALLLLRLAPFYLWFGVLSAQAHKEERFMFPVYALVCFNAAVSLFVARAVLEKGYLRLTRSPYRTSRTRIFGLFTSAVLCATAAAGVLRSVAQTHHYGAPMKILDALPADAGRVCYAKEWHRFPSHFFVPSRVDVRFARSAFSGILPHKFGHGAQSTLDGVEKRVVDTLDGLVAWPWPETRTVPTSVNEHNRDEPDRYVNITTCDYLVDSQVGTPSALEPRRDDWKKVHCLPFLDAEASRVAAHTLSLSERIAATLARILWLPDMVSRRIPGAQSVQYGHYCLYKHS